MLSPIVSEGRWQAFKIDKVGQGLYEWLVIPLGLCNTPTMLMHLMDDVLHPFINSSIIVYLYEISVFIST